MSENHLIATPGDPSFDTLCSRLAAASSKLGAADAWPSDQIRACVEAGLFRWQVAQQQGGAGWSATEIVEANLRLSAACLTTTFVLTQLTGAVKRIANGADAVKQWALEPLLSGQILATLGISHLTTSRRHLTRPALRATADDGGYLLDGFSPWVTGADRVQHVLIGAVLDDQRQVLLLVPTESEGVSVQPPSPLVALTASRTGAVRFEGTRVSADFVVAGPAEDVMGTGVGARTGGLQTSTLALGLASSAVQYVAEQSDQRQELVAAAEQLDADLVRARQRLMRLSAGDGNADTPAELRVEANSLVLRATQAALVAAKGSGYVHGHPAGRWCQEALFFLVWSCPQPVSAANLCEFARIG